MRIQLRSFSLAALICSFVAVAAFRGSAASGLKPGNAFPDLSGFKLEGTLPELKGKIVIVDFWASWCGPCKESFPVMDALQKKYGAQGLVIIGVNEDEKKADMEDFLKDNKVSFTIVRDGAPDGKKLVDKVEIGVMPSSFILDRDGKVRFMHNGFHGAQTKKEYETEVQELLK